MRNIALVVDEVAVSKEPTQKFKLELLTDLILGKISGEFAWC